MLNAIKTTFLLLSLFFVMGCNPFGKNSIININGLLGDLNEPTSFDLNNGGKTGLTTPASGQSSDAHKLVYKLGSTFNQNSQQTADGHHIDVSMKGRQ